MGPKSSKYNQNYHLYLSYNAISRRVFRGISWLLQNTNERTRVKSNQDKCPWIKIWIPGYCHDQLLFAASKNVCKKSKFMSLSKAPHLKLLNREAEKRIHCSIIQFFSVSGCCDSNSGNTLTYWYQGRNQKGYRLIIWLTANPVEGYCWSKFQKDFWPLVFYCTGKLAN